MIQVHCVELPFRLYEGVQQLSKYRFCKLTEAGVKVSATRGDMVCVQKAENEVTITYDMESHFYMALARSMGMNDGIQTIEPRAEELGFMLDCSRNAVMKPEMVKRLICILALAGYTYLELYTEETYALPGEPYFGYMRGRYSEKELTEIIGFAEIFGIEVVPCIQTLAHLKNLANWKPYFDHMDIDDILLAGDERTYQLIRKSLQFCKRIFRTKRINIGTDEAFRLGRGKYTDVYGYRSKHEIYLEHLKRVFTLCREEGFEPEFWADAFYDTQCSQEEIQQIFDGTQYPICWEYSSEDVDWYVEKFTRLKAYAGRVMYAGGLMKWIGHAPDNGYSERVFDAALQATIQCKVNNYLMTAWGDNGAECSAFAVLPSMWYVADKLYPCETDLEKILTELTGYSVAEWKICDELNHMKEGSTKLCNPVKYMLANDVIIGLMDYNTPDFAGAVYEKWLPVFERMAERDSIFSYLFEAYAAICRVLAKKATIGKRLYVAYQGEDVESLRNLTNELRVIQEDARELHRCYRNLWMTENKGFGFEVLDLRIGGLIPRIDTVLSMLEDYLSGKSERIYELEEERLEYFCRDISEEEAGEVVHNCWATAYTVNHI